jgi:hypothetical protein
MDNNSTRILSYSEIITSTTDLFSDAFGIDAALGAILPELHDEPSAMVMAELMEKINHSARVH